ncbi:MAG TPA: hypothetical protein DDX91_08230 [Ruminococcaceae bacterium]|nr:hypothetical protein [Oscillospiraceae bacterium]
MIRFIIEKDNVSVAFDAPTNLLYDRLAFVRVGDIPISGTDNVSIKLIPWSDVKLAETIAKRFSGNDKISEVNALCEKVKHLRPSDEKAFIERLENDDVHGAAQMIDVVEEMDLEAASEINRYDYDEEDEEPIMEQRM